MDGFVLHEDNLLQLVVLAEVIHNKKVTGIDNFNKLGALKNRVQRLLHVFLAVLQVELRDFSLRLTDLFDGIDQVHEPCTLY